MRPFIVSLTLLTPCHAWAQASFSAGDGALEQSSEFQLGGAATLAATVASPALEVEDEPLPRLSFPLRSALEESSRTEHSLGAATVFVSEGLDAGRDALELGTFLSRGQARAGLSVTYLEAESEVARSEVFVDFSVTEEFSVGLSGILDSELGETEPVRQLGLNAEYATSSGTYVQGGVAGAADYNPIIGLSVGLRF